MDRQWLWSNPWGASVTVLFLAHHRTVSRGSYQLSGSTRLDPSLLIHPPGPIPVPSPCAPVLLMSLRPAAGSRGRAKLSWRVIDRPGDPTPFFSVSLPYSVYVAPHLSNYRPGSQAGQLEQGHIKAVWGRAEPDFLCVLLVRSCSRARSEAKKNNTKTLHPFSF